MKIPFSIKYRPQIESGEYEVVTYDGCPARIICWDSPIDKERPIIAIVFDYQIEQYKADGRYDNDHETSNYDLFIITPERELTEFEQLVSDAVEYDASIDSDEQVELVKKEYTAELLKLARNEIVKSGYAIIEKEHYLEEGRKNYERGKEEALKDLPMWKKCAPSTIYNTKLNLVDNGCGRYLMVDGYQIDIDLLLKKLPGFKED